MTTSRALHNHLVALSQKGRRKKEPSKHKRVDAGRVVQLTKVVLHSAKGTLHHSTDRRVSHAPSQEIKKEGNDSKQQDSDKGARDTYYAQQSQQLKQELEQMENKRLETRQKQIEFWGLYKYALEKVSKLNDLRDAPDAILPGNFPPQPNAAAAEEGQSTAPGTRAE